MPSTNAFLSNTPLRGAVPFDAPPPQPLTSLPPRRGPSYDQFGQALLRAYQNGNLAQLNAIYGALQKGLASGIVAAPEGRLGARASQQAPEFFDPSEEQPTRPQAGDRPPAAQAETPMWFDPNEGQPSVEQPLFFDPNEDQSQGAEREQPHNYAGGATSAIEAPLESFADAATLGLAPKAEAALAAAYGHYRYGVPFGQAYDAASQAADERADQLSAAHPYLSAAGALGGIIGGAVGMAPAVEKAGLGAVAGQAWRNVGKAAALGAGMGYADSALHGGDTAENALAAGVGGAVGPIAGKVAGVAVNRVGKLSERGWRALASKLEGVTPADLKAWYAQDLATSGGRSNLAAMVNAHARGEIQGFASQNPAMRGALVDEARSAIAAKGTAPEEMARSAAFRQGMESLDRSSPVSLPQELRDDPAVLDAVKGYQYRGLRIRLADDKLTLDDADTLRQRLGSASVKPGDEFTQARDAVTQAAETQNPGYAKLVGDYKSASNEIAGLSHGQHGGTEANMPPDLQRRISTPEARQGLATGQRQYQNAKALAEVSGGIGKSRDGSGVENMIAGMAETAGGSHVFGLRNVVRGVAAILKGERLPPGVQLRLARAMATTDPNEFHDAIEHLIHANVSLDKIRALQSAFSASAGAKAGSVFWPSGPL